MRDTVFFRQAELLLKMLPLIYREDMFALKGGTAINFFIRDLPRLSVDIDLTYLPVNERGFALDDINRALIRVSEENKRRIPGTIKCSVIPRGEIFSTALNWIELGVGWDDITWPKRRGLL